MNPNTPDIGELRNKEHACKELVMRVSLNLAAHNFAESAEDPGWDAEYQEDMLRDFVLDYADAIRERRLAEGHRRQPS